MRVFVANRGEIAVRIVRACEEAGYETVVAVTSPERDCLAAQLATAVHVLSGEGVAAYLDAEGLAAAAVETRCDLLHPGYGFLSESAALRRACDKTGVTVAGPDAELLELFGDKSASRAAAVEANVPVLPATRADASREDVDAFVAEHNAGIMIKAAAGGGGRGMRAVPPGGDVGEAWERARSEALRSFGSDAVFAELWVRRARHIEVQIAADADGAVVSLGDRDCSLQRRYQKVVEIAPAPNLPQSTRAEITEAAKRLLSGRGYCGVATVEFLVDADDMSRWWFIEVNPRLQVEHPITEAVTGVDIVQLQLALAQGVSLQQLGLGSTPPSRGVAIEMRVAAERAGSNGQSIPTHGTVRGVSWPAGPGVRVDTWLIDHTHVTGTFDSLIAKLVVCTAGGFDAAWRKALSALAQTEIDGLETNIELLEAIVTDAQVREWDVTTDWFEHSGVGERLAASRTAGPHGQLTAPMSGVVVDVLANDGHEVTLGQPILILEAMKMEHVVASPGSGRVDRVEVTVGDRVREGERLAQLLLDDAGEHQADAQDQVDVNAPRADLDLLNERRSLLQDCARPSAVAKRHDIGMRTARENIEALVEPGSFSEYGGFAVAAQQRRRNMNDLRANTPADGIVTGIGRINSELAAAAGNDGRCAVLAYDYTVLAGTQGYHNHKKTDRMLELAERMLLPVVLFAEGGGGRPGDTDTTVVSGLDVPTFATMGRLSGAVPLIGIAAGRCFAGNAALLGCCDVIIATENSTIGMGGPAMIEGGGLGTYRPEEVGPIDVQRRNGVVDIVVKDEAEAVSVAKRYLAYFQGSTAEWSVADQRRLRHLVPENRVRSYDVRAVIETLADAGTVLELRRDFAPGMVTALVRIEGRPMGAVANNPGHLGGALDVPAATKLRRFLKLCSAHGLPVLSLCDTPGFMVGPDAEAEASVRHFPGLFVVGSHLRVPIVTIILRKAYGLGAQAMAGGSFHVPAATLAWPTAEVGAMGLEGAVRLGFKRELDAATGPGEREKLEAKLLDAAYERGRAVNAASAVELDDVIDPEQTRRRILAAIGPSGAFGPRTPDAHTAIYVDTW